jgi:hypothetical protein
MTVRLQRRLVQCATAFGTMHQWRQSKLMRTDVTCAATAGCHVQTNGRSAAQTGNADLVSGTLGSSRP